MQPERLVETWSRQTKVVNNVKWSGDFKNHIFVDDGANPADIRHTPMEPQDQKFRKSQIRLLCLMSAFQHQNFQFFKEFYACVKHRPITCWPNSALIPTSRSSNLNNFWRAPAYFCLGQNEQIWMKMCRFQINTCFHQNELWIRHTHQNDGKE